MDKQRDTLQQSLKSSERQLMEANQRMTQAYYHDSTQEEKRDAAKFLISQLRQVQEERD